MSVRTLAAKAGVATGTICNVESGQPASLEIYHRIAKALHREVTVGLVQPGHAATTRDGTDIVHAFMGEAEATVLRAHGGGLAIDEPWQHFHFAGRADVLHWDLERSALLHLENRTGFPDVQDALGRFGTKRRYLSTALAASLGFTRPPRTETHVIVALWSNEVMRVLRRDAVSFQVACPDPPDALMRWWAGQPPEGSKTRSLVLFDPFATGRQQRFLSLEDALGGARARIHDYADAAERIRALK
jgi:hypothetical protein